MNRVCSVSGCPALYPKAEGPRCKQHRKDAERARGSRQQRGYDSGHDALRKAWLPKVASGKVRCWRCGKPIVAGSSWHLGHDDDDRSVHRGPEHVDCNLGAAGRASHRGDRRR